jgi:stalled ribosome rescue protein Dom34
MNEQINLRLPENLLVAATTYSEEHGFGTVQEFIKETVREKLFDEPKVSREELALVKQLASLAEEKNLYGTEADLFKKLKK